MPVFDQAVILWTGLFTPELNLLWVLIAVGLARRAPGGFRVGALVGVAAASLSCTVLKRVFGRERPPEELALIIETNASFPSGHATAAGALVGIALVTRRPWLIALAVVHAVVIGWTRLYVGVHWLSDVMAGWILGAVVAYVVCRLMMRLWGRDSARF
ncbi:putative integral membrane protein [Corynebacterium renale]|uniref:phosphatase PAP2 family protein n=1 Tax=Corynebacterium renale TaxID=1724 RepID=UPI000DA38E94|nr:phosphatase PAP2 family protein [Corynebacterium renale]SQG63493.1 putative integral membrane protein [Corynebacterium renale]STD00413.1 putative integral membrane protein [Corynebacterium renale]